MKKETETWSSYSSGNCWRMHGCSSSLRGFANSKNASNKCSGSSLHYTQYTLLILLEPNIPWVLWNCWPGGMLNTKLVLTGTRVVWQWRTFRTSDEGLGGTVSRKRWLACSKRMQWYGTNGEGMSRRQLVNQADIVMANTCVFVSVCGVSQFHWGSCMVGPINRAVMSGEAAQSLLRDQR